MARVLTGLAVLAVAVIAAVVSFAHIESLALAHGQPLVAARLLPLSVDGLIVAASLSLLAEARAQREAPRLARAGLVLGVVATVAANVTYGARYGVVGGVISGWPAASFIVASEILLGMIRRAGVHPAHTPAQETVSEAVADTVPAAVPGIGPATVPVDTVSPRPAERPRTVSASRARRRARNAEQVFSAEIEAGTLPSIREIKRRARCGTTRARSIRDELADLMAGQEAQDVAA